MTLEGQQFSRYRILQLIGKGGMGEVYLTEDTRVRRQIAAKFIKIEAVQADPDAAASMLRLFWREATTIAGLDHPNILPLYDHGETTFDGFLVAYLIIPYRPDGSLTTWLRKRVQIEQTRQLTLGQVAHVIRQASIALQYAHDHHVMHLDVKPANFLIRCHSATDEYPDLVLSDFGIARLVSTTSSMSQNMRGTPTYMAPEQWANQPVFASDQYALAIMAYELLTGRPPFLGTPLSVMFAHVHEQPRPTRELNPLLPPGVDLVLQRALAKNPEARYPSVVIFAQAFQAAIQGLGEMTIQIFAPASDVDVTFRRSSSAPWPVSSQPAGSGASSNTTRAAQALVPRSPITSTQFALRPPNSTTFPPSPIPAPSERRRSPFLTVIPVFLVLALIVGGIIGIYGVVANGRSGQNTASRGVGQSSPISTSVMTQTQNLAWHVRSLGGTNLLYSVIWAKSQFIVVGQGATILTSSNGHDWALQHADTPVTLTSVAWSGRQFVVIGTYGTILTSPDGRTWAVQQAGDASDHNTLVYVVWSGSQFLVVGDHGLVLTSPDGITWAPHNAGTLQQLWGVMWSGSQYVAVGDRGVILTSPDGITWTAQNSGTAQLISSVAWSGKQFVAVGFNDTLLTSPDGHTWTAQNVNVLVNLLRITRAGSLYVVVGDRGVILTSPDGITWIVQNSETTEQLYSVAWSGQRYVVVGNNDTLVTS